MINFINPLSLQRRALLTTAGLMSEIIKAFSINGNENLSRPAPITAFLMECFVWYGQR